ncbi:hypothetical protein HA402_006590 [Bradysia odoriphaga]|nr:hypothetical protein HA402_006590 [Bradysia odoriphaga]
MVKSTVVVIVFGLLMFGVVFTEIKGGKYWGCHHGYCWKYCRVSKSGCPVNADASDVDGTVLHPWCYTSNYEGYSKCSSDSDCSRNWPCYGWCTNG